VASCIRGSAFKFDDKEVIAYVRQYRELWQVVLEPEEQS